MSRIKKLFISLIPSGFLLRLSILNILVLVTGIVFSSWAIYSTACFLAAGVGNLDAQGQKQFNNALLNYIWIFMVTTAVIGSIFHFYVMKRLIQPIRKLINSTKQMKLGHYPDPIDIFRTDEVGQLIEQYNELLAQLQRNESHREKLVSDLSHEIRTPLANLSGYLQALKDEELAGDRVLFTALYEESHRLTQMINQLEQLKEWDYLREQAIIQKKPQAIEKLINQCVAIFDRTFVKEGIQVKVEAEPCDLAVHSDGIQQVISNLLDNAIQYYEGTDPIVVTGDKQAGKYLISIEGPGTPIPEAEKDHIFKRFYRLDASRNRMTGGSGLGLAISKEIVERHHQGEIGVRTTNQQNTFWFSLPLKHS